MPHDRGEQPASTSAAQNALSPSTAALTASPRVRLDLRGGGWVLVLTGVICLLLLVWALAGVFVRRARPIGDGRHVESYGYDLSTCLVDRRYLVAAGFPRDGVPALTDPEVFTPPQLIQFDQEQRKAHAGKYLVSNDRVLGVVVNGVLALLLIASGKAGRRTAMPYGPGLALGAVLVLLLHQV